MFRMPRVRVKSASWMPFGGRCELPAVKVIACFQHETVHHAAGLGGYECICSDAGCRGIEKPAFAWVTGPTNARFCRAVAALSRWQSNLYERLNGKRMAGVA